MDICKEVEWECEGLVVRYNPDNDQVTLHERGPKGLHEVADLTTRTADQVEFLRTMSELFSAVATEVNTVLISRREALEERVAQSKQKVGCDINDYVSNYQKKNLKGAL